MSLSLDAALSGLLEQQRNMELIANNVANVNTTGYKHAQVHFQSLLDSAQILAALRGELPPGTSTTASGVELSLVEHGFEQGTLRESGAPLDLAIVGEGLFRVLREDGTPAYTRDGSFRIDAEGRVVTWDGLLLDPPITLPSGTTHISIGGDGTMYARRPMTEAELAAREPGETVTDIDDGVGTIALVRFDQPEALASIGQNLYIPTDGSGAPIEGTAGSEGFGQVVNGFLEASNVDMAEEITNLIAASRAYQMNLSAYRTIEEMLRQAGDVTL